MKTGRRKIYWDSACWLAWLNGEGVETWPVSVVQGIKDVVTEVEANRAILLTSALTRGEIFQGKLSQAKKDMFANVLKRRNVREINADARIFDEASRIREYHANQPEKRRISTPDATHLATAALYGADEFLTMDGLKKGGQNKRKLIALSGDVGGHNLTVVHPYPRNAPPRQLVGVKGPLFDGPPSETIEPREKPKAADAGGLPESGS